MIIATIANEDFQLESLDDAQTLLTIMAKAQRIDSTYLGDGKGYIYYIKGHERDQIGIKVVANREILSFDEAKLLIDEDRKKRGVEP